MPATTSDIAKYLGIHRTSVTRALQGKMVSPETVRRVKEAAELLGYRPNQLAKIMITGRTGMVGVLVSDLQNPYTARLVETLQAVLLSKNLHLFLANYQSDFDKYRKCLDLMILDRRVDGVFVTMPSMDVEKMEQELRQYLDSGIPIIIYGENAKPLQPSTHSLYTDFYSAGRDVAAHLFQFGHRQVGTVLGVYPTPTSITEARTVGLLQYFRERGFPIDESAYVIPCGVTPEEAHGATHRLLDRNPGITAIMAINDILALGVFKAARERGLSIPEDLSVAAFDNTIFSEFLNITSVDCDELGRATEAVEIMSNLLTRKDEAPPRTITRLHTMHLVPRGSTGPVPQKAGN